MQVNGGKVCVQVARCFFTVVGLGVAFFRWGVVETVTAVSAGLGISLVISLRLAYCFSRTILKLRSIIKNLSFLPSIFMNNFT
jgi:hypothetical protein